MPINFFSFPPEIRNKIYEEMFRSPDGITILPHKFDGVVAVPRNEYLRLLRANKELNREAGSFFYGMNRFNIHHAKYRCRYIIPDVQGSQPQFQTLESFLDSIGQKNACLVRHISVEFPLPPEQETEFGENSTLTLGLIQNRCPNIAILELEMFTSWLCSGVAVRMPWYRQEHLELIDKHLKAIRSLEKVTIRVDQASSVNVVERLRRHGWPIKQEYLEPDSVTTCLPLFR